MNRVLCSRDDCIGSPRKLLQIMTTQAKGNPLISQWRYFVSSVSWLWQIGMRTFKLHRFFCPFAFILLVLSIDAIVYGQFGFVDKSQMASQRSHTNRPQAFRCTITRNLVLYAITNLLVLVYRGNSPFLSHIPATRRERERKREGDIHKVIVWLSMWYHPAKL